MKNRTEINTKMKVREEKKKSITNTKSLTFFSKVEQGKINMYCVLFLTWSSVTIVK